MADAIGLDATRFAADFASAEAGRAVADGIAEASRLGLSGTPTLLVNGAPFAGSTYPELPAAIAAATPR